MALDYNHDLRAADKNIASSMELIKAAKADLKPKLSGDANFQYTGNPIELTVNLPQSNPLTFEGRDMKYGASLSLMQPLYTGGCIRESIRLAKHQQSMNVHQEELLHSSVCYQTDMQYWNAVARRELMNIATDYRNSVASLALSANALRLDLSTLKTCSWQKSNSMKPNTRYCRHVTVLRPDAWRSTP